MNAAIVFVAGLLVGLAGPTVVLLRRGMTGAGSLGSITEQVTYQTLHTASRAAPALRGGLMPGTASKAVGHLRELLDTPALAIGDETGMLAWAGVGDHHSDTVAAVTSEVLRGCSTVTVGSDRMSCGDEHCPIHHAVGAPLTVEGTVVGSLVAYGPSASPGLVRAVNEVARWVSGQLELAELDRSKSRMVDAEVRALRAQISPHFIYNSLTAVASFVRTDPDRARNLLIEFADFTRYSFRQHGEFTTLAEELRSIDQYLNLERARFGDRLNVTLRIAPEVLPVAVPFLCLQPLVENAVRHGMDGKVGSSHITIVAEDAGADALISVEDDGVGMNPEKVRRTLAGKPDAGTGIALGNIDARLRQVYGESYGLAVETAIGAGTKITIRMPKYQVGVHASS